MVLPRKCAFNKPDQPRLCLSYVTLDLIGWCVDGDQHAAHVEVIAGAILVREIVPDYRVEETSRHVRRLRPRQTDIPQIHVVSRRDESPAKERVAALDQEWFVIPARPALFHFGYRHIPLTKFGG